MRIQIDRNLCLGCEACTELVPDVLEMEDEIATVTLEVIPEDLEEDAMEAAESCPTGAISIEED
jgi:ferredoxin